MFNTGQIYVSENVLKIAEENEIMALLERHKKLDDDTKDRLVTFIRFCEDIKKEDAKSLIRHITHVIE